MKKIPIVFVLLLTMSLTSFALYKRYGVSPSTAARERFEQLPAKVKNELQARYLSMYPKVALPLHVREDLLLEEQYVQEAFLDEMSPFIPDLVLGEFSRTPPAHIRPVAHLATLSDADVLLYTTGFRRTDRHRFTLQTLSRSTGEVIGSTDLTYIDEGFHIQAEISADGRLIRIFDAVTKEDVRYLYVSDEGKIRTVYLPNS